MTFSVSPTINVTSPITITYDYCAENDSPFDPAGEISNPTPGVISAEVADDHCSPVDFTGGDTTPSFPPIIDKGETWSYQCSRPLPRGSLVDVATFTGGSTRDGRPWPKRTVRTAFCNRQLATVVGTNKADTLTGTPGPDVIVARDGNDVVEGLGGDDIVCGGPGNDTLRGMAGNDTLRARAGRTSSSAAPARHADRRAGRGYRASLRPISCLQSRGAASRRGRSASPPGFRRRGRCP